MQKKKKMQKNKKNLHFVPRKDIFFVAMIKQTYLEKLDTMSLSNTLIKISCI